MSVPSLTLFPGIQHLMFDKSQFRAFQCRLAFISVPELCTLLIG